MWKIISLLGICHLSGISGLSRVLLRDVEALTFSKGRYTNGRRSSPAPQLSRIGGSAPKGFEPQSAQCYNRGHDGVDVGWECKADMDSGVEFGQLHVTCEGYDYPEDPYILRGSCSLEYYLESSSTGSRTGFQKRKESSSTGGNMFTLLSLAFVAFAIYRSCASRQTRDPTHPSSDYPRGGGGWAHPDSARSDFKDSSYSRQTDTGYSRQTGTGGGSGFWTGLGLGSLGGYAFGRNNAPSSFRDNYSDYRERDDEPSSTRTSTGFAETRRR